MIIGFRLLFISLAVFEFEHKSFKIGHFLHGCKIHKKTYMFDTYDVELFGILIDIKIPVNEIIFIPGF